MLWSQTQDRRLKDPEHQLLDAITAESLMSIWSRLPTPSTRADRCFTRSVPRRRSLSCAWVTQ